MSAIAPGPAQSAAGGPFAEYAGAPNSYDEMLAGPGQMRPHWHKLATAIEQLGADELARRWEQAQRLIRENGITYNAYGDPEDAERPWELDALPLLIDAAEWRTIARGLAQRAHLLNAVLTDLYGPQRLLRQGLLPAELVFAHPGFQRAFHGQRPAGNRFLHLYTADLARSPDGQWWVVADRTDAPLGAGYALENRIVLSRTLPAIFHEGQVERLAPFFIAMRETLGALAPEKREQPRVVLLSEGPKHPNYFEDAYLSRYLGYVLVEAGDLAVRNDQVLLKTLGGLLPVDVVLRRLSEQHSDPLELRGDPALGVPGLMQAVAAGKVAVANALGSGLVESPAFLPFLPRLCRELLGEDLLLPSAATWWCADGSARQYVLDNAQRLLIKSAYRMRHQDTGDAIGFDPHDNAALATAIQTRPERYVGQEPILRSTAPGYTGSALGPLYIGMRTYLVASGGTYRVMPGGLVRTSTSSDPLDRSILAGKGSKDVWVLSEGPVQVVSLLSLPGQSFELRRSGTELPSRVADNLFWLGRHVERAEGSARLLRTVLVRLTGEADPTTLPELEPLLRALAEQGQIEPGFVVEGIRDQLPAIEQALPASVLDEQQPNSLRATLAAMFRTTSIVRDRLSIDAWRILNRIEGELDPYTGRRDVELSELLGLVSKTIIDLSAFDGLAMESMTRTQGWRFLDLGRRLERSLHTIALVRNALVKSQQHEGPVLEAILEVADSLMTYRSRYLGAFHVAPVLDLLLTDETNPRSLAFQLAALADHVENLPRDQNQALRGPDQRIALSVLTSIRMVDVAALCEVEENGERAKLYRMLGRLTDQLPRLSDLITHKYLIHAGVPRQFAEARAEPRP